MLCLLIPAVLLLAGLIKKRCNIQAS